MTEISNAGFPSQDELVFKLGRRFFSFSNTGHKDEVFKEFNRRKRRIGTCDINFNIIGD